MFMASTGCRILRFSSINLFFILRKNSLGKESLLVNISGTLFVMIFSRKEYEQMSTFQKREIFWTFSEETFS